MVRKVAYPWTCEFCFSFWVTFAVMTGFGLEGIGWRTIVIDFFVIVAEANLLMALWFVLRLFIRWLGAQSK
jgi:hypothetical protein